MKKEKDSAVNRFLENPAHFCDLFNGSLFGGKQVLKAGSLESLPGEAIVSFADKDGRKVKVSQSRSHTVHYGFIYDGDEKVDEALVLIMKGPHSYTAEDTVEIDCHGGILMVKKIPMSMR